MLGTCGTWVDCPSNPVSSISYKRVLEEFSGHFATYSVYILVRSIVEVLQRALHFLFAILVWATINNHLRALAYSSSTAITWRIHLSD